MYYKTERGSLVPIENIKAIVPNKNGCHVLLKTGQEVADERPAEQVFEEIRSMGHLDDNTDKYLGLVNDAFTNLAEKIASFQEATTASIANLESTFNKTVKNTDAVIKTNFKRIDSTVREMERQSDAWGRGTTTFRKRAEELSNLVDQVNEIIQDDIIQETEG